MKHKRYRLIAKVMYIYLFIKDMDYVNGKWVKEEAEEEE